MLAVKVLQRHQIDVTALTFTTPFFDAAKAKISASHLNVPLLAEDITEEHLQMLKSPRYGYGKNMNPCIDCHTLMLKIAGRKMESVGADFLATGEVLGQRPMSQTRQSLYVVAKNSGYADSILRPLSAQLLEPIKAEREGKIDRLKLEGISGRGRKDQMRLADEFGISQYPPPAGGCLLTDPMFSRRLREMMERGEDRLIRDYHLLKYGRHFRLESGTKIIVGRNASDNQALQRLTLESDLVCNMANHPGPYVLVPSGDPQAMVTAAALCVRYSDAPNDQESAVICHYRDQESIIQSAPASKEDCEKYIL